MSPGTAPAITATAHPLTQTLHKQPTRTSLEASSLTMLLPVLLISASFLIPGKTEVVTSFNSCPSFFLDNQLPDALKPLDPVRICQEYQGTYYFATMYDKKNRIPMYSAYVYNPRPAARPEEWMIEPQLVSSSYDSNMVIEKDSKIPKEDIKKSQATTDDYKLVPPKVNKGHLNPVVHQYDDASKNATFTLTNIVSQYKKLNEGPWMDYETKTMAQKQTQYGCTKIYALVGAVPGPYYISADRVNYPSDMWAAACCLTAQGSRQSWGILASNDYTKPAVVTEYTLTELEHELATLYGGKVDLFHSSCY